MVLDVLLYGCETWSIRDLLCPTTDVSEASLVSDGNIS